MVFISSFFRSQNKISFSVFSPTHENLWSLCLSAILLLSGCQIPMHFELLFQYNYFLYTVDYISNGQRLKTFLCSYSGLRLYQDFVYLDQTFHWISNKLSLLCIPFFHHLSFTIFLGKFAKSPKSLFIFLTNTSKQSFPQ